MKRKYIIELINAILIVLFLYTGLSKLRGRETFEFTLSRSPLLHSFAPFISWFLPIAEIIVAVILLIPSKRLLGLKISLGLLSCLTIYLIYMVLFSADLPCSCGGVLEKMSWRNHIWFNIILIALTAFGVVLLKRSIRSRNHSPP